MYDSILIEMKKHFFVLTPIFKRRIIMNYVMMLILFFLLQSFVLFCCLAAGNDPVSQAVSDMEQMEYIKTWLKKHES